MRKFIVLLLMLFAIQANAQVRKIVLLEVFTNSGCGTCANSNEILQKFYSQYYGGVISVRYHPNFPDPRDPMYADAAEEIDNRVAYYGIMYTPQALFDGETYGSPESEKQLWDAMQQRLSETSPVWIDVNSRIVDDSIKTTVKITAYGSLNEREMKLRVALTERMVSFDEPPGANGETDFPDVFRKMLPDTNGVSLSAISAGDTLSFAFSAQINPDWQRQNLSVVAWIQSDATKEVFQANSDVPTLIIESDERFVRRLETNQSYNKDYRIVNYSDSEIPLKINYVTNYFYENWQYNLTYAGNDFDSLETILQPHDTLSFTEFLQTDEHASLLASFISVKNTSDIFSYGFRYNNFAYAPQPDVLIINPANETDLANNLLPIIRDTLQFDYACVSSEDTRYWLEEINSADFESAILLTGNEIPAYENNDVEAVLSILDNGGTALVSGQRVLSTRGYYQSSRNLCDTYLDIQFMERSTKSEIAGIASDEISAGLNFTLSGSYAPEPEVVTSKNGNSVLLFTLAYDTSKYVAMRNAYDNYKTVYTGFGIDEIPDTATLQTFLERVYNWFDTHPNEVNESETVPAKFELSQNYPNPFNPTTTIKYAIPANANVETHGRVSLRIYNILGEEIATLVNQKQSPGNYSVTFDANNLASGVYFYTLRVGNFVATKKMILLK